MIKMISALSTVMSLLTLTVSSQETQLDRLSNSFLGFGWLVGFPYDAVFIPSQTPYHPPSIKDFFKQKNKYGIRLNEESEVEYLLSQGVELKLCGVDGDSFGVDIKPVLAYYSVEYINLPKSQGGNELLKPYSEMLQVFKYQNRVDSVMYRFGMHVNYMFKPIR